MASSAKHFILTVHKGKVLLSRAQEIVPHRTYEIIHSPRPFLPVTWTAIGLPTSLLTTNRSVEGIGLGESTKKKSDKL